VGASSFTALSPQYETRALKIVYGIQFHPGESLDASPAEYLNAHLSLSADLEKVSDTEYINHLQGVRFTIEESTSKQQFINWLKTPDIHLMYMGHARYGRGPCFGARGIDLATQTIVKTEDWEEGSNALSGIFRMGYPFFGIEVSEVIEHGYTANPMKESEGRPARADCDPSMRGYLGSLRARTPEQIHPQLLAQLRNHTDGDKYWTFGGSDRHIIHKAGWRNTLSSPSELGAIHDPADPDNTQMRCRVFAHLGCTTFTHNFPVVRQIARWRRDGNERYAFWTTNLSYPPHAVGPWVHAVISYNRWNAFASWDASLRWAVQRVNRSIRAGHGSYRVI
jgi:hypothetical protein